MTTNRERTIISSMDLATFGLALQLTLQAALPQRERKSERTVVPIGTTDDPLSSVLGRYPPAHTRLAMDALGFLIREGRLFVGARSAAELDALLEERLLSAEFAELLSKENVTRVVRRLDALRTQKSTAAEPPDFSEMVRSARVTGAARLKLMEAARLVDEFGKAEDETPADRQSADPLADLGESLSIEDALATLPAEIAENWYDLLALIPVLGTLVVGVVVAGGSELFSKPLGEAVAENLHRSTRALMVHLAARGSARARAVLGPAEIPDFAALRERYGELQRLIDERASHVSPGEHVPLSA